MAEVRIGGHQGMDVLRFTYNVPPSFIRKQALHERDDGHGHYSGVPNADLYEHNIRALHNEYRFLEVMDGSGVTPAPLVKGSDYIDQEDLGTNEGAYDMELYRRNCAKMLATLRSRNVRHGDLTFPNMIIHDDRTRLVDWQEAHFIGELPPQKSPYSDSFLLMRTIAGTPGPDNQCDTPRVARRWMAVLGALGAVRDLSLPLRGKKFMDLGCFQGDFPAWAAAEGMIAYGLDQGGFRTGENSIDIGRGIWDGFPFGEVKLRQGQIINQECFEYDVVMMFSTWSYIVQDYSRSEAERLLWRIMHECGTFFFETQLAGDGPGPSFLETDKDVENLLETFGRVEHLTRIPVTGRPAERSVWMVEAR